MARNGYTIIDTHHHVGEGSSATSLNGIGVESTASVDRQEEVETRLSVMDANGIDQAVVIPGHGYLRPDGVKDTRRINDGIAAYRDANPTRFPAAIGIAEPLYGPAGIEELVRLKQDLGMVGVSFHTRFQGTSISSPLVFALVERMAELGLVPYVHAISEITDENLLHVMELGRAFPSVEMVVLDAFSSFEQSAQAFTVAELAPNLIFDSSLAYHVERVVAFAHRLGPHRVIFGTDLYSAPFGYRRSSVLDGLLDSDLSSEALTEILSGNVARLLGL